MEQISIEMEQIPIEIEDIILSYNDIWHNSLRDVRKRINHSYEKQLTVIYINELDRIKHIIECVIDNMFIKNEHVIDQVFFKSENDSGELQTIHIVSGQLKDISVKKGVYLMISLKFGDSIPNEVKLKIQYFINENFGVIFLDEKLYIAINVKSS